MNNHSLKCSNLTRKPPRTLLESSAHEEAPSDSPVWGDALFGYRTQIAFQQIPDINTGRVILGQKHSRSGQGPVEAYDRVAIGAAVPLKERALGGQLVQPEASV